MSQENLANIDPIHRSKPETVQRMFDDISPRYDLANTVLSFGIHHLWRNTLVARSGVKAGMQILDVATGTGDLAMLFARKVSSSGKVIGVDFSEQMLVHARAKAQLKNLQIEYQFQDATNLNFKDNSFDIVTISFGIRNVSDATVALKEFYRVLKPGGRLLVLEFGTRPKTAWGKLFAWYSKNILPVIGGLVTGQRQAYTYLENSSSAFPSASDFLELVSAAADFRNSQCKALMGGIAYLYITEKH